MPAAKMTLEKIGAKVDTFSTTVGGLSKKSETLLARIDVLSERMEKGFAATEANIEKLAILVAKGFSQIDAKFDLMEPRFDHLEAELSYIHRCLDSLEERGASSAGFAKEIDQMRARLAHIEKQLKIKS